MKMNKSLAAGGFCWPITFNPSKAFLWWMLAPAAAESLVYLNRCSFWESFFLQEQNVSNKDKFSWCNYLLIHITNVYWCCWLSVAFHWGMFLFIDRDLNTEEIKWETIKWVKIPPHTNKNEMLKIILKFSCVGEAVLIVVIYSLL